MITLTVDVNEAEYTEVQIQLQRALRGQRVWRRVLLTFYSLVNLGTLYLLGRDKSLGAGFLLAILLPINALIGIVTASIKKPSLGKQYATASMTLNGTNVEIDGEGYRWNNPGKTHGILYWPAFTAWVETPHAITLVRGGLLYILQKSALKDEALTELRNLCTANIGNEKHAPSAVVK